MVLITFVFFSITFVLMLSIMSWSINLMLKKKSCASINDREKVDFSSKTKNRKSSTGGNKYDAVIIGSGVVGSALAIVLGRFGKSVLVVERDLGDNVDKNKIIGELLQPGGVSILRSLRMEGILNGFPQKRISGYIMNYKQRHSINHYPLQTRMKSFEGIGFHNHFFVNALRSELQKYPNVRVVEGTVTKTVSNSNGTVTGVEYLLRNGSATPNLQRENVSVSSDLVIACDGCFSSFRNKEQLKSVEICGYFLGMCLKDCVLKDPSKAIIELNCSSLILIYPIAEREVRMLIDFKRKMNRNELKQKLLSFRDHLPTEILEAFDRCVRDDEFRIMPNQVLHPIEKRPDGFIQMGDSFNMRHPVTGAGMTVGLSDVYFFAQCFADTDFSDFDEVKESYKKFLRYRKRENATLNILACGLYDTLDIEKKQCFVDGLLQYIGRDGYYSTGPMRLLSGLSRDESELIFHFINVSFVVMRSELNGFPTPQKLLKAYRTLRMGVDILTPYILKEGNDLVTRAICYLARLLFYLNL